MADKNAERIASGILTSGRYTAMVSWLIDQGGFGEVALAPPALDGVAPEALLSLIAGFQTLAARTIRASGEASGDEPAIVADGDFGPRTLKAFERLIGRAAAAVIDMRAILATGDEERAILVAHDGGLDDEGALSNEVFFARHPDLERRPLRKSEKKLIKEWKAIRDGLVRPAITERKGLPPVKPEIETPLRKHRKKAGYIGYGGGKVYNVLRDLRSRGVVNTGDDTIEMLQRMANVESLGQIQGINSWDNAHLSVGFLQWPVLYHNPTGKLQRWIQRAPEPFREHGIELDERRAWHFKRGKSSYTSVAIRGANVPDDLRSLQWGERFYRAGLEPAAIAAEVDLALIVIAEALGKIVKRVGDGFVPYYERSVVLRALIQETYNNRPAFLRRALKRAMVRAENESLTESDGARFTEILQQTIPAVYAEKGRPIPGRNMVEKTGSLFL